MITLKLIKYISILGLTLSILILGAPVDAQRNWFNVGDKTFSIQLDQDQAFCIDHQWNKGETGYLIWLWLCSKGPAQIFQMKNGKIQHVDSGLCMAFQGTPAPGIGLPMILDKCKIAQKFSLVRDPISKKFYIIWKDILMTQPITYCLDLQYNNIAKGATIWLYACNYAPAQNWIKIAPTPTYNPNV